MCSESSSLGNSMDIAEGKSKVDASCKEVLANKTVLAKILQEICKEYKGMSLKEIEALIEPPQVGSLPVDKDFTGQKINGMANEDSSNYEGLVKYDVRFKAKCPGKKDEYNELIINVEAQGVFHPGYSLVTRGIYYASRMISAQNQIEFNHSHYDRVTGHRLNRWLEQERLKAFVLRCLLFNHCVFPSPVISLSLPGCYPFGEDSELATLPQKIQVPHLRAPQALGSTNRY